jgi:hypothetical protein
MTGGDPPEKAVDKQKTLRRDEGSVSKLHHPSRTSRDAAFKRGIFLPAIAASTMPNPAMMSPEVFADGVPAVAEAGRWL